MTECTCQHTIDQLKLLAREGIIAELQYQLARCEEERDVMSRHIDRLTLELAIARGELHFGETKCESDL